MKHEHEWTPYSDEGRLQPFRGCRCGMVLARNSKLVDTNENIGPAWRATWMDLMEDAGWGERKEVIMMKEYTGCTEPGCDCEKAPYEGCDCPTIEYPAEGDLPASEEAHCVVSAEYNDGNGETPICHACEHFTSFHVVNEAVMISARQASKKVHLFRSLEPGTQPICGSETIWIRGAEPKETMDDVDCLKCKKVIITKDLICAAFGARCDHKRRKAGECLDCGVDLTKVDWKSTNTVPFCAHKDEVTK